MAEVKICDYCGEEVLAAARKCRWCGEFFDVELRDERRRTAREDQGWALPLLVPIVLVIQGLIFLPLIVICAFSEAEQPVLTGLGILICGAVLIGGTAATSFAAGSRLRVLLVAGANLLGIGLGLVAINALGIPPGPPSPLLACLGVGLTFASFGLATFVLVRRRLSSDRNPGGGAEQ